MDTLLDLDRIPKLYQLAGLLDRPATTPEELADLLQEVEQQPMEVLLLGRELATQRLSSRGPGWTTGADHLQAINLILECKDPDILSALTDGPRDFGELGDYLGAFA